ncbi:ribonuclease D [Kangiella sp. TOML190]|uniref:ribonuclease D n=1 Tax=Kangiella sp. TOML190 TaxID=2931351 RepID=UPI00203ABF7E|nr:ribonuclease D [Kangiella sp. TOML190]
MENFKLQEHGESLKVKFIRNVANLSELAEQWLQQEVIAVDTEFDRTNTYFHNLALIQLYDGNKVYLIDPLELQDLSPLKAVFASKTLIKTLHSCSEDLEALFNSYQFSFNSVFDTQIAASFAGFGLTLGYSNLVDITQGLTLDKQQTQTDWLQRPLSQEQLTYAAQDVQFLLPAYYQLRDKLLIAGHFDFVIQDAQSVFEAVSCPENFDAYYIRVKGAFKLNAKQLNRLKLIVSWREQLARLNNIPKTFIFRDHQLVEICLKAQPKTSDLLAVGCHRASIRRYGSELLALIEQADKMPPDEYPEPIIAFHKLPQAKPIVKQLKQKAAIIAEQESIPAGVLVNNRLLEYYVSLKLKKPNRPNRFWNKWRKSLLSEAFEATCSELASS